MLVRKSINLSLVFILKLLLNVLKWTNPNECLSQHQSINGRLLWHCPSHLTAKISVLGRDLRRKRTVTVNLLCSRVATLGAGSLGNVVVIYFTFRCVKVTVAGSHRWQSRAAPSTVEVERMKYAENHAWLEMLRDFPGPGGLGLAPAEHVV